MKQYWVKFHASGQCSIRVEPCGMVQPIIHKVVHRKQDGSKMVYVDNFRWTTWYGSANHSCHNVNKMVVPIRLQAVLLLCKLIEGIWNNYIDIEQKIMQVTFSISLCTWGYISLGDPTRQEVWRKILLNTNSWYLTERPKPWKACMHTLFLLTKSAAVHLFHWY